MTKSQERAVARIWQEAINEFSWKELKEFTVDENEFFVSVVAEIGSPEDEGTLAQVFCRERVHVFIGKRGGITYPYNKVLKNGDVKWSRRKYRRFLSTAIDQR